jgi:hypothetical protein
MLLLEPSRGDRRIKWVHALVVVAAASALISVRNTPPEFPSAQSVHAFKSSTQHHQRPRFDNSSPNYFAAPPASALFPLTVVQTQLTFATALFPSFQSKGAHYNRPPPLL